MVNEQLSSAAEANNQTTYSIMGRSLRAAARAPSTGSK